MEWHFGYGGAVMTLLMLIFWVAIIALVVWAFRSATRSEQNTTPARPRPLDILETRYARGEIDDEEFERRRKVLEGT